MDLYSPVIPLFSPVVLRFSLMVPLFSLVFPLFSLMVLPLFFVIFPFSSVVFYLSLVFFSLLVSHISVVFSSPTPHTPLTPCPPTTLPCRQLLKITLLPPEDDLLQEDLFEEILKWKQDHIEKLDLASMKKLRFLLMACLREEETIWLMFEYFRCSPTIKINNDWQMAITSKKIYVMDDIVLLATLY